MPLFDTRVRGGKKAGPLPLAAAPTERGRRLRRVLLASDAVAIGLAAVLTTLVFHSDDAVLSDGMQLTTVAICLPTFFLLAHFVGLYHLSERHIDYSLAEEAGPVLMTLTAWAWLVTLVSSAVAGSSLRIAWFAIFWGVALVGLLIGRSVVRKATRDMSWYRQQVLVLGDPLGVDRVLRRIRRHSECGLDPVGAIHRANRVLRAYSYDENGDRHELGTTGGCTAAEVLELVRDAGVHRVIVTGWAEGIDERTELIRLLATSGVYVDIVSGEPEALCAGASIHHIEGLPFMTVRPTGMTRVGSAVKRAIDVAVSGSALLVLSPLLAYTAVRIKLDSKGSVLFRQKRAGRDGRTFEIVKFRTMVDHADELREELRAGTVEQELFKLREDPRVTGYGAKIRRTSVDELPQLWNVLRGDMSLVGPRPLPLDEAPMACDHFAERTRVRPGITGPWQIHGRSDIPFEDMVKLDYTYVSTWSLQEDLRLLIRTVGVVAGGRGAY